MFILKKAKVYTVIFMTSILLLSGSPYVVSAESKPAIEALPEKILFHVDNMKPGDCTIQTYTVSNRGRENSEYVLTSQFTRGSKKLYNQLQLTIKQRDGMLYRGKLSEFSGFSIQELAAGDADQFEFRIDFPYESGNGYQGLVTHFNIVLQTAAPTAEAGTTLTDTNPNHRLPDTASTIYTYLLIGALFLLLGGIVYYRTYRKKTVIYGERSFK